MPMETTKHTIRLNNRDMVVATPADDPIVTDKLLLTRTRWHPESYRIFADDYEDAPPEDTPADLDMRRGEKRKRIDLSETDCVIVRHKSTLADADPDATVR